MNRLNGKLLVHVLNKCKYSGIISHMPSAYTYQKQEIENACICWAHQIPILFYSSIFRPSIREIKDLSIFYSANIQLLIYIFPSIVLQWVLSFLSKTYFGSECEARDIWSTTIVVDIIHTMRGAKQAHVLSRPEQQNMPVRLLERVPPSPLIYIEVRMLTPRSYTTRNSTTLP